MAAKPKQQKLLVSTDWRTVLSMWSNISAALQTAIATWYAAGEAPKALVSPEAFASVMAVWGLVTIVLRNINQGLETNK